MSSNEESRESQANLSKKMENLNVNKKKKNRLEELLKKSDNDEAENLIKLGRIKKNKKNKKENLRKIESRIQQLVVKHKSLAKEVDELVQQERKLTRKRDDHSNDGDSEN